MGISSSEVRKVIEEKMKYWYKTLSDDAMWSVMVSTFDIYDWLSFFGEWVISDTVFSSLVTKLLLDINFDEIVPNNLLWSIELPDIDEFLRGVMIKLVKIDVKSLIPEFEAAIKNPALFLEDVYARNWETSKLSKGYYGKSRYGESYYDPVAVREFFRSTLIAFTKKRGDIRSVRDKVDEAARTLDINPELTRNLFNRLSAITQIKEQALTWDYGWWDRTYWSEEGSEGKVEFVTYDLQTVKMPYEDLVEYQGGGFWDDAVWDYFYWSEEYPEPIHPFSTEKYNIAKFAEAVCANFRSRITATAMAVANYQTPRERSEWTESLRTHTYGFSMSQRMQLESVTEGIVRRLEPDVNAVKLRLYKTAVLQLAGDLTAIHRWGSEMFQAMSDEELKDWWVGKWESSGLRRDVLESLYTAVIGIVRTSASLRHKERLRFLRRKLISR